MKTNNDNGLQNVLFNFFLEMKKKDVDKRQRANLIAKYLEDNNMTQGELAKELGMSKSTLYDWMLINRIPEEEYDKYKKDGMTDTSIYRMLRNNKLADTSDFDMLMFKQEINKSISKYQSLIRYGKHIDSELYESVKKLVNILQRVMIHKERKN